MAGLMLSVGPPRAEAGDDLYFGVLELSPTFDSLYVRSGEAVVVHMDVSDLDEEVKACQAFLGYNSLDLTAVDVAPGGGDWDELIYQYIGSPGEIDTAIGVRSASVTGTAADGTVAVITLIAGPHEGLTRIVFRIDVDDVESTFLSSMDARIVWPDRVDSPLIVIDNTPPSITIAGAQQSGQELIGTGRSAVQGTVAIAIEADDALSGLFGHPAVTVTPDGGLPEEAAFVSEIPEGTFNYAWTVTETTPNGPATIHAAAGDKAGNIAEATPQVFNVNKNRITGTIELDSFVGTSRDVTFVATGGARKEWTLTVGPFVGCVADFTLDDVPDATTALSAKTAWNLRSRVAVTLDGDGQGAADLTGADKLPGGDLDESNTVDVPDYNLMKLDWYSSAARSDINGNGGVNVTDYNIMKLNWYTTGDPE
jgi:hypothetical protein